MKSMDRRSFLKTTALAGVSLSLFPRLARSQPIGANGDIRVAVVGFGGRGRDHIGG